MVDARKKIRKSNSKILGDLFMSLEATLNKIQNNPLYKKSCSIHKQYQFHQFQQDGKIMNGQVPRKEDINGLVEGEPGYDASTASIVLYNFKDGVLHSEPENEPAVQYRGHIEYWNNGLITKVIDYVQEIEESWENGVPVKIIENMNKGK